MIVTVTGGGQVDCVAEDDGTLLVPAEVDVEAEEVAVDVVDCWTWLDEIELLVEVGKFELGLVDGAVEEGVLVVLPTVVVEPPVVESEVDDETILLVEELLADCEELDGEGVDEPDDESVDVEVAKVCLISAYIFVGTHHRSFRERWETIIPRRLSLSVQVLFDGCHSGIQLTVELVCVGEELEEALRLLVELSPTEEAEGEGVDDGGVAEGDEEETEEIVDDEDVD